MGNLEQKFYPFKVKKIKLQHWNNLYTSKERFLFVLESSTEVETFQEYWIPNSSPAVSHVSGGVNALLLFLSVILVNENLKNDVHI
jgi:hypothetical protein